MDSGVVRDFIISITGGLIIISFILIGIIGFVIYLQIKKLITSVKDTLQAVKDLNTEIKQTIKSGKNIFNVINRVGEVTQEKK